MRYQQQNTLLLKTFLTFIIVIASPATFAENKVKINKDLSYLDVQHNGKTIRIERIQNTKNTLTNVFAKTSRVCPPFCINPIEISPNVKTVGELELLNFLDNEVKNNKGLLVDARMPDWYEKGTIPSSVNIPFSILIKGFENKYTSRIHKLLGAIERNGEWDYSNALALMLYCNGAWCGTSTKAIKNLIQMGYPEGKLFWYRSGMQSWQQLGLTTITP